MKNTTIFYLKIFNFGGEIFSMFEKACIRNVEPQRQKTYQQICAPSEDSDQPPPSHSLLRILTWHI